MSEQFNRDELEVLAFNGETHTERALARMLLAGMDSKPVAYPEKLPCPVFLEPGLRFGKGVKTRLVLEAMQRRAERYEELDAMTVEQRAEHDAGIAEFRAMLPAPVAVPDEMLHMAADAIEDLLKSGNRDSSAGVWFDLPGKLRAAMQAEPVTAATVPEIENLEHFIAFWRKVQSGAISPSKNEIDHTVWFLESLAAPEQEVK